MRFYTSMKALQKLDKYYLMLFVVTGILAVLTIFTFRNIFSTVVSAYETEEVSPSQLKIDKSKLDEAYNAIKEKNVVELRVNDGVPVVTPEEEQ